MSGKLDRAIADAETESQNQEIAAEMYVRQRRALGEQIPGVLAKFKAAIKTKCEGNPKHLRFWVVQQGEVKVERLSDPKHRMLEMQLFRESGVIEYECNGATGCFTIRLDGQNLAGICDQDGHAVVSVDDAADEVLSLLFA